MELLVRLFFMDGLSNNRRRLGLLIVRATRV